MATKPTSKRPPQQPAKRKRQSPKATKDAKREFEWMREQHRWITPPTEPAGE